MATDIFIKTCNADAQYHQYCLGSIEKYCKGFRNTVVIEGEHPKGYLQQQVIKLHADTYSDADLFLITDSDTLFTEPVTPESFLRNGKTIWLMTPWTTEMLEHPGTRKWLEVMTDFFGESPPAEFMRRQPFMVPRWLTENLREFCIQRFGRTIGQYVMEKGCFSEFNIMGFYAWLFYRDEISWINTEEELPPPSVRQFWSHDPVSKNLSEINQILE